jgi:CRP/FNR family transcriptional regulator, anaerobic regulatory protein
MSIKRHLIVSANGGTDASRANLEEAFALIGLTDIDQTNLPSIEVSRQKVRAGQPLFGQGDPFDSIFVVRLGTFKTTALDDDGYEQVLGFALRADILGCDAAASGTHTSCCVALEDSEAIAIPLEPFRNLGEVGNVFERHLFRHLSEELNRQNRVLAMIGTLGANARVARFLVSLSERYARMGYSPKNFVLRMTRQDIANHLGLTMETVSRAFSHLCQANLIEVNQRAVTVFCVDRLRVVRPATQPNHSRQTIPYGYVSVPIMSSM